MQQLAGDHFGHDPDAIIGAASAISGAKSPEHVRALVFWWGERYQIIYVRRGKPEFLLNSMKTWLRSTNNEEQIKMSSAVQPQLSILRRKQVQARTGLSRSTIHLYVKAEQFPKPVALGSRAVGWIESEVSDWIAARMQRARGDSKPSK